MSEQLHGRFQGRSICCKAAGIRNPHIGLGRRNVSEIDLFSPRWCFLFTESEGSEFTQQFKRMNITGQLSNVKWLIAVLIVLVISFGCKKKPQLPASYGLYLKNGSEWVAINSGDNWVDIPSKAEFLIFARELAFSPSVNHDIIFYPTLWVRQNIELIQSSANAQPHAYTTEQAGYHAIQSGKQIQLPIEPVPNHNDMIILSSKDRDIAKGYYALKTPLGTLRCAVGVNSPTELQGDAVVDKWYFTLDDRSASPIENFMTLSQKDLGQERVFHGHAIIRFEFHPIADFQLLRERVEHDAEIIVENSPDLGAIIPAANKLFPLDNNAGNALMEKARNRINAKVDELKKSKDWWTLPTLAEAIESDPILKSTHLETLNYAKSIVEKTNASIKEQAEGLLLQSKELGRALSKHDSDDRLTKETHPIVIHENGIAVVNHGFFGGEEIESIWMGKIASVEKEMEHGVIGANIATLHLNQRSDGGHWEKQFFFKDASNRDTFINAVDKAHAEWDARNSKVLSQAFIARPNVYGEKIWVKDCSYQFDVNDESASYEVLTDGVHKYTKSAGGQDLLLNQCDYIQIKSICGKPLQVAFRWFPYKNN